MSDFFIRFNISQRDHAQIIVIAGVRFVGMINKFEIAADFKALGFTKPDYVRTISLTGFSLNDAYHGVFCNVKPRK